MRKTLSATFLFLTFLLSFSTSVKAQNLANITASAIQDVNGNPLAYGSMCFQAENPQQQIINFQVGGGGQVVNGASLGCAGIQNGALQGSVTLPNPQFTTPKGVLYHINVTSNNRTVLDYHGVGFEGGTFNFDLYSPGNPAPVPWATGGNVNGSLGVNGNFNVTGNSVVQNLTIVGACTGCGTGGGAGNVITVVNAGSTGTTANRLAKFVTTSAQSTAVITATTDTGGIVGVVISGAGTSGSASIQIVGIVGCVFDGATTAGDYVQNSTGTAGDCHDAGSTYPTSGQVLGRVMTTNGSGGTFNMDLFSAEIQAASGGGGGPTVKVNGSNTADQTQANFINSTVNGVGLSATVSNPSGGQIKVEIGGNNYSGKAATATAAATTPSLCPTGQVPNGVNATFNAVNCQPLNVAGDVSPIAFGAKFDTHSIRDGTWSTGASAISSPATSIVNAVISSGGSGYAVNDVLTVPGGSSGTLKVSTVSSGVITAVTVNTAGINYSNSVTVPVSVTGGAGTGAVFYVMVSSDAPFNPATDVGKNVYGTCGDTDLFTLRGIPLGTISTVTDAQHITISTTTADACSANGEVVWGTDDTAALLAWAGTMKCAAVESATNSGNVTQRFVMPNGGTMFHQQLFNGLNICQNRPGSGGTLIGAGSTSTWLYPMPNFSSTGMLLDTPSGLFFDDSGVLAMDEVGGFTMDGDGILFSTVFGYPSGAAVHLSSVSYLHDIEFILFATEYATMYEQSGNGIVIQNLFFSGNKNNTGCVESYSQTGEITHIGGTNTNNGSYGLCISNANNNAAIPTHFTIIGLLKDEDATVPNTKIIDSVNVHIIGSTFYGQTNIYGASEVWSEGSHFSDFNGDGSPNFTSMLLNDSTTKLHAHASSFVGRGTGEAVNNTGTFFDEGGNSLSGNSAVISGGTVFGSASATGVSQTSGNIALSGGWGTSPTKTNISGDSRTEQFTITADNTVGANPTITVTFPTPFFAAPICSAQMIGGTGTVTALTTTTGPSTSGATFTFNGTPAASATYVIRVSCSN